MAFTKIETGGISSTAQITLNTVNVSGVSTLGVVSATSLNVSGVSNLGVTSTTNLSSQTLNVSSASTVSNVTISSGSVVGTAGTLIAGVGIQSAGVSIATTAKTLNFIGAGNTFNVVGDRVDISIQSGGGAGVSSTGILTCRGFANSSKITESIIMNDFYNQGTNYGMLGPIEVSVGATITVGLGVSYAIL